MKLGVILLLALTCLLHGAERKPNVILILADDLGYETIGANGGTSYKTPAIDKLASGGMRFDHCYVQPLCTPTRIQLMTGAYNVRNYVDFGEMDSNLVTFGNLFQKAGYATCIAGKWQLGRRLDLPKKFGFDEYYLWQHMRRPPRYANPGLEISGVETNYSNGEYGPDVIHRHALDFLGRHKDKPFFLYYPMLLTHDPFQPTPDSPDWDPKAIGEEVNQHPRHYGEMVAYMDKLIGRLIAKVDDLGLRENTLIIFMGDNGTASRITSSLQGGSRQGAKGRTVIAGMHVPCIVSWPGQVAAGKVCPDLVDSTDFLPTLCAAANVKIPVELKVDGRSFLPQLQGKKGEPREWIYSWYSPRREPPRECAFNTRSKLYRNGDFYDLRGDPEEKTPLKVADLKDEAAKDARVLRSALDQYKEARPAHLPVTVRPIKKKNVS